MRIAINPMWPNTNPWQQVCTILNPYWVASAVETAPNDPVDLDYDTYGKLYNDWKLSVYLIADNDTGNIIGYCLAIPMRALTSSIRTVEVISLYIIRKYRGHHMHAVMRALKSCVAETHADCQYMTIGLPQPNKKKFGEPCYLLCRMPLRGDE